MNDVLEELVGMSQELGAPPPTTWRSSARETPPRGRTRKRSGSRLPGIQLGRAGRDGFVRVRSAPILAALDGPPLDDAALRELLKAATVEGQRAPSIETFLHALCLEHSGVRFVGHTHPSVAVGLLSGRHSRELFAGALFPDQIVVLGPALAYVPYADPGLPLALAVRQALGDYLDRHQRQPKVLLMENHGRYRGRQHRAGVLNITHMLVKTCRILAGSLLAGGPRFLTPEQVERIDRRPDELARRKGFA